MVGFAGTGLTFAAWAMKGAVPLRLFGIASSVAFLSYGALLGSWPVMVTEMVLLPLNALRLWQLLQARRSAGRPVRAVAPSPRHAPRRSAAVVRRSPGCARLRGGTGRRRA